MLHRYAGDRAGPLVARLAQVLNEVPSDPLAPEWLATPSEGMRRWVMLALASCLGSSGAGRADGICANVQPAFADSLRRIVLAADGVERDRDPWSPDRLAWPLLEVMSDGATARDLRVPWSPEASRYGVARQIADHFDGYHVHRPAMVRAWADGSDVDGVGSRLPVDMVWQPRLWRHLRQVVAEPSAPERWPRLLERLRDGAIELDLPDRLLIFGFSLLPSGDFLDLLSAVATTREVHLFLLEPAAYDGRTLRSAAPAPMGGLRPRIDDQSASVALHPLLRSWGRPQRETAVLLADAEAEGLPPAEHVGTGPGEDGVATSLLARLQADIRSNRISAPDFEPSPDDRSVQFHACYGPARQVAALRDTVLHLIADHPDLREEEIVVLCPALDRFAPLIETVLGPSAPAAGAAFTIDPLTPESGTTPPLRYRIVDQSVRMTNEVAEATLALLDLVSGRFEAPAVVDFMTRPPVRERFGFDEDEVAAIDRWVVANRVRWGLDPGHRVSFGLSPSVTSNTWQAAIDRLLIGSVVNADQVAVATGGVVPYSIEGGSVDCAGRLAQALSILHELATATGSARPVAEWLDLVQRAVRSLLSTPPETEWQLDAVERALAEALDAAGGSEPSAAVIDWIDVRRLLGEHLGARRGRNDFFRGGVTITSLIPLRWVPFRVVCLLGMDQAALTGRNPSGDDLAQSPAVLGDRDARGDLRQALLEAVLAADGHLLLFRDGHNPRTNKEIPRAVAVAELFEALLDMVPPALCDEMAHRLEIDHPCHPFDERCFTEGGLLDGMRWGFGGGDLDGARARLHRRATKEDFLAEPLEPRETGVIEFADLRAFFDDPTGAFLLQRLGVRMPRRADRPEAALPVKLDPLSRWQIGDRLLNARLDGHSVESALAHERGLGTVPPGKLGEELLEDIVTLVEGLVRCARDLGVESGLAPVSIDILLPQGRRIVGAIPMSFGLGRPGPALFTYSREKPSQRVRAWLDLMALSAAWPDRDWRSVVVCRGEKDVPLSSEYVLAPLDEDSPTPIECLELAVTIYRMGMDEPLPMFPKLSHALCHHPKGLAGIWRSSPGSPGGPGEGESPAVELVHGRCEVDAILELPAREGDPGQLSESSRATRLARSFYCTVASSMRSESEKPAKRSRRR